MILIDIYFLLNFIFDFLLLQSMVLFLRKHRQIRRLFAGAMTGAVWSCIAVSGICPPWMELPVTYLLCPYLMCRLVCGMRSKSETIHAFICFYVCACMGSGVMNLIYERIGTSHRMWTMILAMAGVQLCLTVIFRICDIKKKQQTLFCKTELNFHGRIWVTDGIWDTGNRLFGNDRRPVHLLDAAGMDQLLDEAEKAAVEAFWRRLDGEQMEECYDDILLLQPVPYCGVGGGNGILPAFTIEQMVVWRDGQAVTLEKPLVGISKTMFSNGKKYRVIINTMGL